MLIIGVPSGHYHMHIFRVREVQLQILMPVFLDYGESVGVLGDVRVEEVVVYVQEVVHKLSVQLVVVVAYPVAVLKTLVAVSALGSETVDCHFVDSIEVNWLIVNSDCIH